jgi:hypothetical protein
MRARRPESMGSHSANLRNLGLRFGMRHFSAYSNRRYLSRRESTIRQ